MRRGVTFFIFLSAVAGCDGAGTTAGGAGGGGAGGGGGAADAYSVTFDSVTVSPGEERTQCVVKRLDNPAAMHVHRIANKLGPGSHHLIVYRVSDTAEQTTPFDCVPFTNLLNPAQGIPLMISQKEEDTLELPEGVGLAFEPGQMVRLEMHYINATSSPFEVTATSTFHAMDEATFKDEADFAFFANTAIDLPPQSEVTMDPLYIALPEQLEGVNFFAITGHVHELGTGVTVASTTGEDGADTMIYDPPSFSWSEPPTVYLDPPLVVPPGGGFRFQCAWKNTTPEQVTFGESAKDEMCLFYTYYYPSKGAVSCAYTDMLGGGTTFCCPGHPICAMLP